MENKSKTLSSPVTLSFSDFRSFSLPELEGGFTSCSASSSFSVGIVSSFSGLDGGSSLTFLLCSKHCKNKGAKINLSLS